ncbi:hypothetical protein KS4_05350 [Poriferisphaera corsica]|uniref:Transcription factor zinc-finger domain-containing protein n=1 Tax=Poriferisphaera corsica TaxID=2528020 RepID=A0A517YQK2_9BACT|nr:zf-TFIIB domain-containing protein [Poriferisphaera corsica]QDU32503.1 hypothetical protein KS4_05350 [Poriferisphaera corsica]
MARFSFTSARKCPKCMIHDLKELEVKKRNIKIDQCPSCQGIWFDANELDQVLGATGLGEVGASEKVLSSCKCPACQTNSMCELMFPETMVKVDICGRCHGVWLDGGEFDEIRAVLKRKRDTEREAVIASTQKTVGTSSIDPLDEETPPREVHVPSHIRDENHKLRQTYQYDDDAMRRNEYRMDDRLSSNRRKNRNESKTSRFFDFLEDVFDVFT